MRELALTLFLVFGATAHAAAQADPVLFDGVAVRLSPADQMTYDSIRAEWNAAAALYITAAVAGGLGLVSLVGALLTEVGAIFTFWDASSAGTYLGWMDGFLVTAAGLGGLAVGSLAVAIALNIDAGSRRRGLAEQYRVQLSTTGIAFSGAF